jgi:hypothetical protein
MKLNKNGKEFGAGRPSKMQVWLPALIRILENEDITFLTDENVVLLVNRTLPEPERISKETFKKWKAGKFAPDEELGKEFIGCIELALIRQKQELGKKMLTDTTGQWTRFAWLLERKFTEWNLKHISENINKNEQSTVIQITAGSEEQRKLIDNLINVDFTEIKPEALLQKNDVEQTDNTEEDELPF